MRHRGGGYLSQPCLTFTLISYSKYVRLTYYYYYLIKQRGVGRNQRNLRNNKREAEEEKINMDGDVRSFLAKVTVS